MQNPVSPVSALVARRRALSESFGGPALLAAGLPRSRNFKANHYRFRACSHFLYFAGKSLEGSAVLFADGKCSLFTLPPDPADALWHGPRPELAELREQMGFDEVRALAELPEVLRAQQGAVATLPTEDPRSAQWLSELLGRSVEASTGSKLEAPDAGLADAIISLRLTHDEAGLAQLRHAARVSAQAHITGMRVTRPGMTEAQVAAEMVAELRRAGHDDAYGPIVTVRGEVLHCTNYDGVLKAGDLMLVDVGGETPEGWAADITRSWPVSGTFSPTQRDIYQVVLEAEKSALALAAPGCGYRQLHEAAKRALVTGLVELGIFRGDVDGLLARGAAALFFPHGIGHLLGLDVHDMEDLGDRAGYAQGRERAKAFGDAFLRLDRDLEAGMVVTIEPGFYQVPGILSDARYTDPFGKDLCRETLARFSDVRGIRIEDDVLITEGGCEVLTADVPKEVSEVEALVGAGRPD